MKPYLRDREPKELSEIPETTAYEAGYLVSKNAGWRNQRPVIDRDRCVGCLKVAVDYDFCKGCGICKKICKIGAIGMEAEK